MSRSLSRRLANAACAFQTGHSVRDWRRTSLERVLLLSRRVAAEKRRAAGKCQSAWIVSHLNARAAALDSAIERCLEGFDREAETFLLNALDVERICIRAFWRAEALDRMGLSHIDDAPQGGLEATIIARCELRCQLYEGLFENGRLDFLFDEKLVGRWDWHCFLHWLRGLSRRWRELRPHGWHLFPRAARRADHFYSRTQGKAKVFCLDELPPRRSEFASSGPP